LVCKIFSTTFGLQTPQKAGAGKTTFQYFDHSMNEGSLLHSVMVVPRPTAENAFHSGEPVELDLKAVGSKFDLAL